VATIRAQQPAPAPAPNTVDARSAERPPAPAAPAAPEPEATRVRGVVPISAQPPARSATTDDHPTAEPVQEHTILRSRPSTEEGDGTAQPGAEDASARDASARDASTRDASTPPRDPRRRLLTWIGVGAAAVVVLAVAAAVVANLVAAPSTSTGPGGQPSDGGSIAVTVVPPPVLVSAVRAPDGASATFTWKTADAQKDDQFTWQQEGTTNGPSVTAEPKVTVTDLTPGVPVCIDVATVRAGRTSEQLKACAS